MAQAEIREVDIKLIHEAEYNPRIKLTPDSREYKSLKDSIRAFGVVEPIVWNERTGNIVGGHQRFAVLKAEGAKTIPCAVVNLTEQDEKELNLALNKIKGKWDYEKLGQLLKEFDIAALDITGFSADELSILIKADDDLNETEQWDEWNDATTEADGASWVIELQFDTADVAERWLMERGFTPRIKTGTATTVIRMEE